MKSIRYMREELGISQIKLAQLAEVSRWRLQSHESGLTELTEEECLRCVDALNEIYGDLLTKFKGHDRGGRDHKFAEV
ncbi:MAG: helix-turn-helix domain-containing protein [Bdellovibrionales bacterium]|nr:helix-turn-helix domain-containing protein [Bdellovibrionales bacterium]